MPNFSRKIESNSVDGGQKCRYAETELNFVVDGIAFCCVPHKEHPIFSSYESFGVDTYLTARELNRINPHSACATCPRYIVGNWNDNGKIKAIRVTDSNICNFKCEYCNWHDSSQKIKYHTGILPIIKQFFNADLLDDRLVVSIATGEPALHNGVDELINYLLEHINGVNIGIASNCSVYNDTFAEVLRKKCGGIICSIDAGTRETFYCIKGVDLFDKVLSNVSKYAENGYVCAKYIILESNYSQDEIIAFIKTMIGINIKHIRFDFNYVDRYEETEIDNRYIQSMALGEFLCNKLNILDKFIPPIFNQEKRLKQVAEEYKEKFERIFNDAFKQY